MRVIGVAVVRHLPEAMMRYVLVVVSARLWAASDCTNLLPTYPL